MCDCYARLKAEIITFDLLILLNVFCLFKHNDPSVQDTPRPDGTNYSLLFSYSKFTQREGFKQRADKQALF